MILRRWLPCVLLLGVLAGVGAAAEPAVPAGGDPLFIPDPFPGDKIVALLGLKVEHPLVRGVIKTREIRERTKGDVGMLSNKSVFMMYHWGVIDSVTINCKTFDDVLPLKIPREATAESLVKRLGKPSDESIGSTRRTRTLYWKDAIKGAVLKAEFDEDRKLAEIEVRLAAEESKPAAGVAEKARADAVERIGKVLPKGWKVEAKEDRLTVTSNEKVRRWVNMPNGPPEPKVVEGVFEFEMEIGPAMARAEYDKQLAQAREVGKKAGEIAATDAKAEADGNPDHIVAFDDPRHAAMMLPYTLEREARGIFFGLPTHGGSGHSLTYRDCPEWTGQRWEWVNTSFANDTQEELCRGVEARVLGLFDCYSWSENANKVAKDLSTNRDKFTITVHYCGPGAKEAKDRPLSIVIRVPVRKDEMDWNWEVAQITSHGAAVAIAELARLGALDKLRDVRGKDFAEPAGPAYTLRLNGGTAEWYGDMGWGAEMAWRLDLMQDMYGTEMLHKVMEPLRKRMETQLEEWGLEKEPPH